MISLKNNIDISRREIDAFSRRWDIQELSFFGSVLTPEFGPKSNVELFVSFKPGVRPELMDMVQMECELREMLGHEVDLVNIIPSNLR
ncbi:MAG: nucleotidyltransferase domain-containing protein [Actinobacteria bacterium]|nr:nucleotidyltransferase domain-containing protein [Actinomycetota bacterium]